MCRDAAPAAAGETDAMADLRTFTGGCHCGQVRFEVTTELDGVIDCNCSICTKHGFLWAFAPAERFAQRAGEEVMGEYRFNRHALRHLFCTVCGVESFARGVDPDGRDTVAVNVRTLDHVDLGGLKRMPFDGRSI